MPRLPQVSGRVLVDAFLKDGWVLIGQKGSHVKLRKNIEGRGRKTIIIP
ncbi:MAG: type II toxin-antitoxin system HicA family toxin [Anaerolineales bacterium]